MGIKIELYDTKLLDKFQAMTGFSDEQVSEWLLKRETRYENDFNHAEWQDEPQFVYDNVHASVICDLNMIVRGFKVYWL